MSEEIVNRIYKLFTSSYNKIPIQEYEVAIEFVNRAFSNICYKDKEFYENNIYLTNIETEYKTDKILRSIVQYYLDGKGSKENFVEDILPIINALHGCKNDLDVEKLKRIFFDLYK
ncbi:hypothetical protein GOM49_07365 [Clostridium bovifaecis]|uniref:Uncharacterized protein n=1 Tax=Clostridium bovifaecis TaxID=2184719 RepID=A0A6I6EMN9_9CLOT|nr:hypothetical protein GOM49_07365 [Clostridium bovifaecis]